MLTRGERNWDEKEREANHLLDAATKYQMALESIATLGDMVNVEKPFKLILEKMNPVGKTAFVVTVPKNVEFELIKLIKEALADESESAFNKIITEQQTS